MCVSLASIGVHVQCPVPDTVLGQPGQVSLSTGGFSQHFSPLPLPSSPSCPTPSPPMAQFNLLSWFSLDPSRFLWLFSPPYLQQTLSSTIPRSSHGLTYVIHLLQQLLRKGKIDIKPGSLQAQHSLCGLSLSLGTSLTSGFCEPFTGLVFNYGVFVTIGKNRAVSQQAQCLCQHLCQQLAYLTAAGCEDFPAEERLAQGTPIATALSWPFSQVTERSSPLQTPSPPCAGSTSEGWTKSRVNVDSLSAISQAQLGTGMLRIPS